MAKIDDLQLHHDFLDESTGRASRVGTAHSNNYETH